MQQPSPIPFAYALARRLIRTDGTNAISFASLAPNHDRFSPSLTINFLTVYYGYGQSGRKELHFYIVNTRSK
ncbi:hypothetical protein TcasGA2_TC011111 [Tribolium castaneum]|uniref:Uncharacterized protein n=1 Tax=Tribolium castaneum TaxID=7070 RepID=D6X484_TRICA|nr:hypothetical protein TcasGA2_TC011111 [Tribolium castaneum]